jgi:hypothetical protein
MYHGMDSTPRSSRTETAPAAPTSRFRRQPQPVSGRRRVHLVALPLALGLAASLAGCDGAGHSPVAPDVTAPVLGTNASLPVLPDGNGSVGMLSNSRGKPDFLRCDPLQNASDTRVIGPAGGQLNIGPHTLTIPAGALAAPTVISGQMPTSAVASVQLSPHGLNFAVPATLELDFRHCQRVAGRPETVVYVDEAGNALEWPVTAVRGQRASATIWHFSQYAMSSGRSNMQ